MGLADFYRKHNPAKLETPRKLVWILRKYSGPEKRAKLMKKLRIKYGLSSVENDNVKQKAPVKENKKQRKKRDLDNAIQEDDDFFGSVDGDSKTGDIPGKKVPEKDAPPTKEEWAESGNVMHLRTTDFPGWRKEHPRGAVMFYTPWCPPCMKLKSHLVEISENEDIVSSNISVAAIDCDSQRWACDRLNITTLPTLSWFDGSDILSGQTNYTDIETKNNKADILEWIMLFVNPLWGPEEVSESDSTIESEVSSTIVKDIESRSHLFGLHKEKQGMFLM